MNLKKVTLAALMMGAMLPAGAQLSSLWSDFVNPPDEARTKLWWFHGETGSTPYGIDADLTAFRDKGVGGVVWYDQVHYSAEGAQDSMSPEWWGLVKHAARKARELGLSFEVAVSNGYVAGGPWITPDLGMQRTDFIDTLVTVSAPGEISLVLPHPNRWFRDVATVVFPDKEEYTPVVMPEADFSLTDNASAEGVVDAGRPLTISGISYTASGRGKGSTGSMNIPGKPQARHFGAGYIDFPPVGHLEYSLDGKIWHTATELPPMENNIGHKSRRRTVSFPAVTGRLFRVRIHDWMDAGGKFPKLTVNGFTLYPRDIVDNVEVKTGLRTEVTYPHAEGGERCVIARSDVRDVTSSMQGDTLRVRLEPGTWRIIRFGHHPTGARTKHGRRNLLGYEADVMSAKAARMQFDNYFKAIHDTLAAIGCPPAGVVIDSHEAGIANWTPGFDNRFRVRNGYDIIPWIPALAGYVVDSRESSDMMLLDYRRTIASTIADEFYGTIASLCDSMGVTLTSQAMLNIDNDNIASRGRAHKPQGEFWAYQTNGNFDCLDAASSAHLYGHPIASGEAFTDTPYSRSWDELKRIANLAYCRGINEFVVCASSHQPWPDRKYDDSQSSHPYIFHRHNPEWSSVGPFWEYQTRCANMLRQGEPVVDLCVYVGEDLPGKTMAYKLPEIPEGYNFDVCTIEALVDRMSVRAGRIEVKGGMSYGALVVQDRTYISPRVKDKIDSLVRDGATVIRCDLGETVADRLANAGIAPDATIESADRPDDKLYFYHRRTPEADIYFFYNHSDGAYSRPLALRTSSRHGELWNPTTLTRTPFDGTLTLSPHESTFLVLKH